jgi:hypothetical protein
MLGTKMRQVKPNTVKDNLAYSFRLKDDPGVSAENNKPITEELFRKKQNELLKTIEEKYGATHPVANQPRLKKEALAADAGAADKKSTQAAPKASPK